jgi:SAM-dependent methyltransferase
VRGTRWLDVATGTGGVALLAAHAGADVVGVDIAPRMIEIARAKAGTLPVRFDVGNAEALPYREAQFDVVSSVFGVIFAPDHGRAANELARVCRARLGLAVWRPNPELEEVYSRFGLFPHEGPDAFEWGRQEYLEALLADAFELEITSRTWTLDAPSGEAVWELWLSGAPPFRTRVESLDPDRREDFRRAYVEYCERFPADGGVAVPREYLVVLGTRR